MSCDFCGDFGFDVTRSLFALFFFTNLCGDLVLLVLFELDHDLHFNLLPGDLSGDLALNFVQLSGFISCGDLDLLVLLEDFALDFIFLPGDRNINFVHSSGFE